MSKNRTSKYPRTLANAEITHRRSHIENLILEDDGQTAVDQEKLKRAVFNLASALPYLFDVISYTVTHHRGAIERADDNKETHYRVRIPVDHFLDFALDGETDQKANLWSEMYRFMQKNPSKVLPLTRGHSIRTQPVRMDIIMENGKRGGMENLKNQSGTQRIKMVVLEFYKPLWRSLFIGEYGREWFLIPKAFHAKLRRWIKMLHDDPEFKPYGDFGTVLNYRRLYMYLNLHDNSSAEMINYDGLELTEACIPKHVHHKNNAVYLDWYPVHQFFQKGLRLFRRMAAEGVMNGVKLAPWSVWYSKPLNQFQVKMIRDKFEEIPEFRSTVNVSDDGGIDF